MSGSGATDRDKLRAGIEDANIPALILCLYQMTGDARWLRAPYAPERGVGIDNNDSGGLPPDIQREIRDAAFAAIGDWLDGRPLAISRPDDETLAHMLSVSMHEDVPPEHGEIIASGMKLDGRPEPRQTAKGLRTIIIGGGISGIAAAVEMHRRGADYILLEKNEDFGGTWWENRYPGCAVDTPNLTYTFSFQPNDWIKNFPPQAELRDYIRLTADQHQLYENSRFQTKVDKAEWIEADQRWRVTATNAAGEEEIFFGEILFSAVGILNIPKSPDIPGLDSFPGPIAHTARWPDDLDLRGKRVAVIGNGASAMQLVPEVADEVGELTVFAKSKQWAAPFPQYKTVMSDGLRHLLATVPLYRDWFEQRLAWMFNDRLYPTLFQDPEWPHKDRSINRINDRHREFYTAYIKSELGDRQDLLPHVLPDYPPYLKRMLMDSGWYRTMTKPNVRLIPDRLAKVDGSRLIAASGEGAEADILVLATGYAASEMLASFEVIGRQGQTLRDFWRVDDADAFLGTLVPGFPNLFILVGPHTGSGHGGSMMRTMESQIHYSMSIIEAMFERGATSAEVRRDVYDAYREEVDDMHAKLMWSHPGTDNWFRNSRGRVTAITPWRNDKFWRMTRKAAPEHLQFGRAESTSLDMQESTEADLPGNGRARAAI